jgi:hypothetical protein
VLLADLQSSDVTLRIEAAQQLGQRPDPAAVPALIRALDDKSVLVQGAAASSLGEMKDSRVPDALAGTLRDPDRDLNFQLVAAIALAKYHDARAARTLISLLPTRRDDASRALIDLGRPATPALAAALREYQVRDIVTRILISIGDGLKDILPLLDKTEARFTRLAAVRVLGEIDDPRAAAALTEFLKEPDLDVAAAACRFLIRQGGPENQERLSAAMQKFGTQEMAADFIASGNPVLRGAAEDWGQTRGISLTSRSTQMPEVHWPGMDPEIRRLTLFHFDGSLSSSAATAAVESEKVSFVPGKWGSALFVDQGGFVKLPAAGSLDLREGTIELWIAPRLDGSNAVYSAHNHPLFIYQSLAGDQVLVSEGKSGDFYGGITAQKKLLEARGGSLALWKSGDWHHIAFTYSESSVRQRLYIDGLMVTENRDKMIVPNLDASGAIFVASDPAKQWSAFSVDELEISSGEKSPDAIRRDMLREFPAADH